MGLIHITQAVALDEGWSFVEVDVPAGQQWPGFAWVLISPTGDVAVMGDGNPQSASYDRNHSGDDISWAKQVIGKPIATWSVTP